MSATSDPFQERRRSERHGVQDVKGTLHVSTDAKILNMSMTGMAVETEAHVSVGRKYAITFRGATDQALRVAGSVVWCRPPNARPADDPDLRSVYDAGFRFDHTLGNRAVDLARILQAVAASEVGKRISGRFKVEVEEQVNLHAAFSCAAKNLSAVGILVETDGSPPLDIVVDAELRFREHALRTRGRIARSREIPGVRGERLRQIGIEFVETSEDGREAIRRFVERCIDRSAGAAAG